MKKSFRGRRPDEILDDVLESIYDQTESAHRLEEQFNFSDCLNNYNRKPIEEDWEIACSDLEGSKPSRVLFDSELAEVLNKLIKDGYLAYHPSSGGSHYDKYSRTFEGRWFINRGGYSVAADEENFDRQYRRALEESQLELQKSQAETTKVQAEIMTQQTRMMEAQTRIQKRVGNLTRWIALGTIIAAFYYATQLIDWLKHLLANMK